MMPFFKFRNMEELRFKVWLHFYQWRKAVLVFITSSLIIIGFFFMMNATQFEDVSTKRDKYGIRASDRTHLSFMKQTYHSISKTKPSNIPTRFLINEPYFCLEKKYLYLIFISSSPDNIEKRMAIRNTWGDPGAMNNTHGAVVFLLGKISNNMRLQKQVYEESMNYRDIIQGDFIDSYKNLTQKSIMALKWFSSYCSQVRFLMKTDDDIFINTVTLSNYLKQKQTKNRWIVGCVKTHAAYPVKMKKNKAIPVLSLPYGHPTFVAGAGYVITNDIIELLYKKSQELKLIPVEDVFVTGHCAKAIGVTPEHNPRFSCGEAVRDFCTLSNTKFTGHRITAEQQENVWNLIHISKACR